jgi:hypothetical protein
MADFSLFGRPWKHKAYWVLSRKTRISSNLFRRKNITTPSSFSRKDLWAFNRLHLGQSDKKREEVWMHLGDTAEISLDMDDPVFYVLFKVIS